MRRKSNLSLAGGALVAAGLLLVAAGCGSSTSSEEVAPTETVAVEETVEVDEVAAAQAIVDNLEKAKKAPELVCDRWLTLSKTRMKIIKESWSGR